MVVLDGMLIRLGFRGGRDGVVPVVVAMVMLAEVDPVARPALVAGEEPTEEATVDTA